MSRDTVPEEEFVPASASVVDPVTLQIVHNRLETLMRLMTRTLEQLAGNEVGREAGDYSTAFMDKDGKIVAFGSAVCTHLGHEVKVVPWIFEHFGRERIKAGDIYLSNDPFSGGAVHSNDVGLLAPVFAEGELIGWVFCDMHCGDVGGMLPGSMSPSAIDAYAESFRWPPTKIYDGGEYRDDVVAAFLNNSRIPEQLQRDLGAKIGALNIGNRAIQSLADQYGAATLARITAALQDFSEQLFRQRLELLPDGVYESCDYQEDGYRSHDILRAFVRLTVAGDELFVDFNGSSPAAPALINCSESGLIGGVMSPLIQQLASGIPFNAGVMRPVHVRAEKGTFINAVSPTPVGIATGYGAWNVQDAMYMAANAAMEASGDPWLRERVTAQWGAVNPAFIFNGFNQYGDFLVFVNMDLMGEGQGAMRGLDGGRGNFTCIGGSIPSIEAHEITEPLLFLSREIWTDSGGAGQWRGGWGLRDAVVIWGEHSGELTGTFCTGRNSAPTVGTAGGYPSSGVYYGPISGTDTGDRLASGEVMTLADLEKTVWDSFESLPSKCIWTGERSLRKGPGGDVFIMTFPGGGGYGDPLERDPVAVAVDVGEHYVTSAAARSVYGVVLSEDGAADVKQTKVERDSLRDARFSAARAGNGAHASHDDRKGSE